MITLGISKSLVPHAFFLFTVEIVNLSVIPFFY